MSETSSSKKRFGKYELVSRLGMGGMAEVYKAQSVLNPRIVVAIKRILPQYSRDQKLVSMLVNEARLSLGLTHPNVVPVLDFGLVNDNYFIAMEYVQGKDLKSIMIRCKTRSIDLPFQMAIAIMIHVLKGLDYAHQKRDHYDQPLQIVHRDISPQNIMISHWGTVKILDFGIAKAAVNSTETQTGILKGKFSYMSPEQSRGKDVDLRTDVYSAGIVCWEMLTLESYFQGETDVKLLERVRSAKTRDPSTVNQKIPQRLAGIVMKALQKNPRKRYQTAGDFAYALEQFQYDTFGEVTDADLAAFVRNLFGVTPQELHQGPAIAAKGSEKLIETGIERALTENAPATEAAKRPSRPAPPRKASRPRRRIRLGPALDSVLRKSIAASIVVLLGLLAWRYPPVRYIKVLDQQIIRVAKLIRGVWGPSAPADESTVIDLTMAESVQPQQSITVSSKAQQVLGDLPFETFERIRERVSDLAFEPRPRDAKADPSRPGYWGIEQSGYEISYRINDQMRAITVESIRK